MADAKPDATSQKTPAPTAKFTAIGDHPADAFILDTLRKKFPKIEDKAMTFMAAQRAAGDDTFDTNPLTSILVAMRDQVMPDMPFDQFVTKFREKATKAMEKKNVTPYTVSVGQVRATHPIMRTSWDLLHALISPFWDGAVGTMRYAASPLADLPQYQSPEQQQLIREGILPSLSEAERKKGQTQVVMGMLGVSAGIQGVMAGPAKTFLGGIVKGSVEGGAWGAAFGAGHGAGQEEAADQIIEDAKSWGVAGAALGAGLHTVGTAIGKGLQRVQKARIERLMKLVDEDRLASAAHAGEMDTPDALKELFPEGGFGPGPARVARAVEGTVANLSPYQPPRGMLANTVEFTNINIEAGARQVLDADKATYLKRLDSILREKNLIYDYATEELHPISTPPAERAQQLKLPARPAVPRLEAPVPLQAQETEREIAYRLIYGDYVYRLKEAEYGMLPNEVKGRINFFDYMDKTEGTQAAQFVRNIEKSARTRLAGRLRASAGKRFDITAASLEGLYHTVDTAVIGAAKLYRLSHLAPDVAIKIWNSEMLQVVGDTPAARSALYAIYTKSKGQLEKMLSNMAPEMHDVRALMQKFEQGKAGMDWYTNAYKELARMFGEEDARLMSGLLAIHSTGTGVDQNVSGALADYALLKAGKSPKGGRFPVNQKRMISQMLKGEPFGDQKVQNFYHSILGVSGHSTNDIQVARAIGWVRDRFSKNQYRFVDEIINGLAKDAGVTTEQYQAALWTTPRIAKAQEANLAGSAKQMSYVMSFRTYPEAVAVKRSQEGIYNTLIRPADEGGGGFTFDPHHLGKWEGKGYIATLTGDVVPEAQLTPGTVLKFEQRMRPLIKQYEKKGVKFTIGLWKQGDGTVSVDLNVVTPDKETATFIGRRTDQYAIGDMSTGSYEGDVPTGKPREEPQRKVSITEVKKVLKDILGAR